MISSPQLNIIIKFLNMNEGLRLDANGTIRFSQQSGSPVHSFAEKHLTFEEEAQYELKNLSSHPSCVVNIYRADGLVFTAQKSSEALSLSLTPQDYVCSTFVKRIHACTQCGVYYKHGNKFKMLWKNTRYSDNRKPVFLSPKLLEKELKKVFTTADVKLGTLQDNIIKYIAWKVKTEKGTFFIPWHNGCIIPADPKWEFEEKKFEELRSIYKVLRFSYATDNRKEFRIVCG